MRPFALFACAAAFLFPPPASAQEWLRTETTHDLTSSSNGKVYRLFVEAPPGLDPGACPKIPTLFITDGNDNFQVVKTVTNGQIPPMVLVGIGYPDQDYMVRAERRSVDLTPTLDEEMVARTMEAYGVNVAYGGGPEFLQFIRDDAIPFIEGNYCASSVRALGGYSYGGLFAAHVLLSAPGLFNRFIIGSPSLWWDDRGIFDMEENFANAHSDLQAQVFMSIGDEEDGEYIGDLFSFSQALRSRKYPSLTVTTRLWEGEDHISAKVPTYHRGVRVIFADLVRPGGE